MAAHKVTYKQIYELDKLYEELGILLESNPTTTKSHRTVVENITELEFKLQDNWNFPRNIAFHTYTMELNGCLCPKMDNAERVGFTETRIITESCPWHGGYNNE